MSGCGDHEHLRPVTVITAFASVLRRNVLETPTDTPVYIFINYRTKQAIYV